MMTVNLVQITPHTGFLAVKQWIEGMGTSSLMETKVNKEVHRKAMAIRPHLMEELA
ncbi:MAG: Uncharacterised protein [Methanobacteriota archaeon]|nr:MAG: Uncharacterised protein [Euryarchaeota archaeon]